MILALLLVVFILAFAGGVAVHPWIFAVCLLAVVLIALDHRGGRVP